MLRDWYVEALNKAQDEGVVLQTRTIYDEYFKDNGTNPETGEPFDPTSIPYFDGDYIPGEIEKIINIINKDESLREESKGANSKSDSKGQKIEGKRKGTRSNPGELVNQHRDKVMNRLDLALARMKSNFFVAQLLSDDFIKAVEHGVDVSSWVEDVESNPLMKTSKQIGKNPDLLEPEVTSSSIRKLPATLSSQVIGNTIDEDPSMEQECLDTRIAFLNFCQKKYMQFDELRRAKYSTMLLLSELHDPRAEKEHQFSVHLQVIAHATSCSGCESNNCRLMKQLFGHVKKCDVTYRNGCKVCCRLFILLTKHARNCDAEIGTCDIPFCERIRERQRRILKQQQVLDDRRRDEQNNRHQEESVST
jgi:E1A/CREB-binding protein